MVDAVPELRFQDVWKTFPMAAHPTLAGISMDCYAPKIHTLIGYSGAGKSVTLRHALGLMQPDQGEVFVRGTSITHCDDETRRALRMNFGMLFQASALFDSLSVFENVAFPIREHRKDFSESEIEDRVHELLRQVGLKDSSYKMPSELSGGMQKRVGLARAIALHPKILLFDEPTTGLDPVTSQHIDDLIAETAERLQATALIISHDVSAALRFSHVVSMLWQGTIIESATPEDFKRSSNEVVRHFLQRAGVL